MKRIALRLISILCVIVMFTVMLVPVVSAEDSTVVTYNDIKIGVMSDLHFHKYTTGINTHLVTMLEYYEQQGVAAVLVTGDIANTAQPEEYDQFFDIWDMVFEDQITAPQLMVTIGNHELQESYLNNETLEVAQERFKSYFRYKDENSKAYLSSVGGELNYHTTLNGYHFIGIASEGDYPDGNFSAEATGAWLEAELEEAVADVPDSPIFVMCHQPIADTTYGGGDGSSRTGAIYDVLKNYPQVVYFSGHSHRPTENERSIWQGEFTCVDVTSLQYVTVEPDYNPEDAYEAQGALLVEIDSATSEMTIERLRIDGSTTPESVKFAKGEAGNWNLPLPLSTDTFVYTDDRVNLRTAPVFDEDAAITVTDYSTSSASIAFPSATHSDYVQGYNVCAVNNATGVTEFSEYYVSDFYIDYTDMATEQQYTLTNLAPSTEYTVLVTAIESFGLESAPLSVQLATKALFNQPAAYNRADFIDINFSAGYEDNSPYRRVYDLYSETNGTKLIHSSELARQVADINGHINYPVSSTALSSLSEAFTMEVSFMVPERVPVSQVIFGNYKSSKGIVMRFDSSGNLKAEAYIGGGLRTVSTAVEADTWYHAVMTYNGTDLTLYLNGVSVGEAECNGEVEFAEDAAWFTVGAGSVTSSGAGASLFAGQIASARVYTQSMTAQQVSDTLTYFELDILYQSVYINLVKLKRVLNVTEVEGLEQLIAEGEAILENAAAGKETLNSYIASSDEFLTSVDCWLYQKPYEIGENITYTETYSYEANGSEHPTIYNETDIATVTYENVNSTYDIEDLQYYFIVQRIDGGTSGYIEYTFNDRYASSLDLNLVLYDAFVTNYSVDYLVRIEALCEGGHEYVTVGSHIVRREAFVNSEAKTVALVSSDGMPEKTVAVRIVLAPHADDGFKAGGVGYTLRLDDVTFDLMPVEASTDEFEDTVKMQSYENLTVQSEAMDNGTYKYGLKTDSALPATVTYTVNDGQICGFKAQLLVMDAFFADMANVLSVTAVRDSSHPLILDFEKDELVKDNGAYSIYSYTVTCKTALPQATSALVFTLDPNNSGFVNYLAMIDSVTLYTEEIPPEIADVNEDESVDVRDLVRIKKYLAKETLIISLVAADINFDGYVNSLDVVGLRKLLL